MAAVGFVIEAQKMQNAMEYQNFQFRWKCAAIIFGISFGYRGRDGNVTERCIVVQRNLGDQETGNRFDRLGFRSFTAGKDNTSVGPCFFRKD